VENDNLQADYLTIYLGPGLPEYSTSRLYPMSPDRAAGTPDLAGKLCQTAGQPLQLRSIQRFGDASPDLA